MCCFSRPIYHVSGTQIFARSVAGGRQALIYSMELTANEEVAMILPIPVAQPAADDALHFIPLLHYPSLFAGLQRAFPAILLPSESRGSLSLSASPPAPPLKVVNVGSFVASFVPTVRDFSRLDEQFRLPDSVWDDLNAYSQFGFAVFQLKRGHARIHPMAFTFPTAMPGRLFFPTVHIHDGKVHPKADFDHTLYCQAAQGGRELLHWDESELPAAKFVNSKAARDLVLGERHLFRKVMAGELANVDITLQVA